MNIGLPLEHPHRVDAEWYNSHQKPFRTEEVGRKPVKLMKLYLNKAIFAIAERESGPWLQEDHESIHLDQENILLIDQIGLHTVLTERVPAEVAT